MKSRQLHKRRSWNVSLKPELANLKKTEPLLFLHWAFWPRVGKQFTGKHYWNSKSIWIIEKEVWYRHFLIKLTSASFAFCYCAILAFFGGMIQYHACLAVISLKVLHFGTIANQDRKVSVKHGLFFALGILVSFGISWHSFCSPINRWSFWMGFQLQERFLLPFSSLCFALTLSLLTVWVWNRVASVAQELELQAKTSFETQSQKRLLAASFFSEF